MNKIDENASNIEDNFKDRNNSLQLFFVCVMWLAEFNTLFVSTMYLEDILDADAYLY